MDSRRGLERRLSAVEGFSDPDPDLEQYPTPADVAAHLVFLADSCGDLAGRPVLDLGSGTGMLALGAACRAPCRVVGIERDADALAVARENERRVDPAIAVDWIRGDATRPPLSCDDATALMNPPFGAQNENVGADRAFLAVAAELGEVSYSIHNEGSRSFVESFAADNGGRVDRAYAVTLSTPRQFSFHERERAEIPAEAYRIEWD